MSQSAATYKPYRFSWFVEKKLAAMAWPRDDTVPYLADQGITVLVNLTTEPTAYQRAAIGLGIQCVTVAMPDFCPPTNDQVKDLIELIDKTISTGGALGIHCAMGCGRTGTILACYLVAREGYTAEDAIKETRRRRKGSIETRRQEQAVHDYEKSLKEDGDSQ